MRAGWLNNSRKVIYSMMLGFFAVPVVADKAKTSELPDLAFLEFLAEMEMVDGNLVSPTDLLELNKEPGQKQGKIPEDPEQLAILQLLNSSSLNLTEEQTNQTQLKQAVKADDNKEEEKQ